jgi:hypothetical protein
MPVEPIDDAFQPVYAVLGLPAPREFVPIPGIAHHLYFSSLPAKGDE